MKLDKIKFAKLIAYISSQFEVMLIEHQIEALDSIINVEVPEPIEHHCYPKNENVERLMMLMVEGTRKLDAIREHRAITGMGLKESKDAVERHWVAKPIEPKSSATLGDLLRAARPPVNFDKFEG